MNIASLKNVLASQISHPKEKFTILVVDDEPINVLLLEETLAASGYETLGAKNGPQARQLAKERIPDLILLDIMMPGETGFEVIKKLKDDSRTNHIPVIFLTAAADVEKKLEGFRLGAVDYIVKPFHPEEVNARIKLHLKLSRANQLLISCASNQLKETTASLSQELHLIKPADLPEARFDLYHQLRQRQGGDFFDVEKISGNIFSFFVADIASHENNKAFLCASMLQMLRQNASPIYTPLDTMTMLNGVLGEIMAGSDSHLTGCLAHLNRETRQISVTNSAHPPILNIPKNAPPYFLELPFTHK